MSEITHVFINPDEPVTQIESFCASCEGKGMTRLLLCSIPFFKDVIVMSFSCDECGYKNNEIQSAGSLAEKGVRIVLKLTNPEMLNREVVKSEWATIKIPDIELEIPASTQKGSFSTVEGILTKSYDELSYLQPERRISDPVTAQKIDEFLERLSRLKQGESFTFELDDPSGNSYIAHDIATYKHAMNDPSLTITHYARTVQQMVAMGYMTEEQAEEEKKVPEVEEKITAHGQDFSQPLGSNPTEEVIEMATRCFACFKEGTVKTCLTNIPHFKETLVMAFSCDYCGAKSNEVKGGGGISEKARRITLNMNNETDLSRFVIKSDSASVEIPEIGLELTHGTMGPLVTTVEGLISKIHEELSKNISFVVGDSKDNADNRRFTDFFSSLLEMKKGRQFFYRIIIDDPLSNSYIAGVGENDLQLEIVDYERSEEQNEELGITDMNADV